MKSLIEWVVNFFDELRLAYWAWRNPIDKSKQEWRTWPGPRDTMIASKDDIIRYKYEQELQEDTDRCQKECSDIIKQINDKQPKDT